MNFASHFVGFAGISLGPESEEATFAGFDYVKLLVLRMLSARS